MSLNMKQTLIFKVQKMSRMRKRSECGQGHIGVYQVQKFDKEETFVLLIEEFHASRGKFLFIRMINKK